MLRKRRHTIGFGYIGFGNNQKVFNQEAKVLFSTYKEKLDLEAHLHYKMHFLHKNLSKTDKEKIKSKIRRQERKTVITSAVISGILFMGLAFFVYYLITTILSHQ